MKSNKRKKLFFTIFFLISLAISLLVPYKFEFYRPFFDRVNLTHFKLNHSKNFNKIYINGTADWIDFRNAGYCSGLGTYSDPYVIEDLIIDGEGIGSCIRIENSNVYFRIENCTLYNSGYDFYYSEAAIMLFNVNNSYLTQNQVFDNFVGVYSYGFNNSIIENTIVNNQIGALADGECVISNNNISNNLCGIFCINYLNISHNYINNNDQFGILINWGGYNLIEYNSVEDNNGIGIFLDDSHYNIISNNNCSNNKGNGIHLEGMIDPWGDPWRSSTNNLITSNIVNNNFCGIMLNITQENQVDNNIINNNKFGGIEVYFSAEIEITNNEINQNRYGVKIAESITNNVLQNTINYNYYGIYLISSDAIDIIGNTLHYNKKCYIETGECRSIDYEDNDCIELPSDIINWVILLGVISVTSLLGILILLFRRKRT
ncbi:MAG: nitrous oxide reductase family maturation protein NosD [Candidatus Heimdallarchaeota archaeon]